MHKVNLIIKTIFFLALTSCSNLTTNLSYSDALENWQEWRKDYDITVVGEGGWLSLAGLYWLSEGTNTIGSAKNNNIQFPQDTPEFLASIVISNNRVKINAIADGILINSEEINVSELSLEDKTLVSFGDYEFFIIQREIGFAIRLINNQSTQRKEFTGTQFYPFTENLIVKAKLIQPSENDTLKTPTVYGTTREDKSAGWLEFEIDGVPQRLQAVSYGKENLIFVMFSDATSGDTTYGAGRYIEVEWPDKNGDTTIDFNRAYNPACAFTDYATCPLTPPKNRLKVAIKAGELDVEY